MSIPLVPEGTALGQLSPLEVFDWYDGPRLFSCRAATGQLFLALWLDGDRGPEEWLYLPLTAARLAALRAGAVDLHTAFARPEEGRLWKVRVPLPAGPADAQPLAAADLDHDLLPYENELLCGPAARLPAAGPVVPVPGPRGIDAESSSS